MHFLLSRITPAGAGKTQMLKCWIPKHTDHPRRCGENYSTIARLRDVVGSPPQVRGKLLLVTSFWIVLRITPAGAGKTPLHKGYFSVLKDHPRRCGENDDIQPEFPNVAGSPPQVRGKPDKLGSSA